MNRQQRRAALRALPTLPPPEQPPLCRPGRHQLMPIEGTVKGETVAKVVICSRCRRTFAEILAEDADYAAMYQAWVDAGEPDDWPPAESPA